MDTRQSSKLLFAGCGATLFLLMLAACGSGAKPPVAATGTSAAPEQAREAAAAPSPAKGSAQRKAAPPDSMKRLPIERRLAREKWHADLDDIVKHRLLRILVTPGKLGFYFNGSQMQGAVYDVSREFEKFLNRKLNTGNLTIHAVFIPVARENLVSMLAEGSGDLVASLVGVNQRYEHDVDYTDPLYDLAKVVIVSGPGSSTVSQLSDLAGKEVYYYQNTVPYNKLTALSDSFTKEGKPPIRLVAADGNLQVEDLLEMVNAGLVPMTLAENQVAKIFAKVMPQLRIHSEVVVAEGPVSWAVQKNTPKLLSLVNEFIVDHRLGTAYGNTVARKYLNDEKWVKDATARKDLQRFESVVKFFRLYGDQYDFPYLLLAAQGYQESGLNPNLRSRAGAVGVMQIKPSTAAASPILIRDVRKTDHNVEAGAKYMRYMIDQYYAGEPMDPVTKGIFAVASYNAGPNRIRKLRARAAAEGYDPNRWFNNVEVIADREIGRETVQYVGNIYKYYLAYKLVTDRDAQRQAARENTANRSVNK